VSSRAKTRSRLSKDLNPLKKKGLGHLDSKANQQRYREPHLTETERLYRDLFENARDLVFMISPQKKISMVNRAVESLSGWSQSEIIGKSYRNFFHPEDLKAIEKRLNSVLSGKADGPIEFRVRTKSGKYIYMEFLGRPWVVDGKVAGVFGIARDITARRRAEEALQERIKLEKVIAELSSYFINISLDNFDVGVNYALSEVGAFFSVDRCYLFQISGDEERISNTHEWCAEGIESEIKKLQNLPAKSLQWLIRHLKRQEVFHLPCVQEFPLKSGVEKRFFKNKKLKSILCIPIAYSGRLIGFLGLDSVRRERIWDEDTILMLRLIGETFASLMERLEMEEALRESEEKYRMTLDSMGDMIHMVDRDLRFILFNKAFQKMNKELGLETDVIGKTVSEVFPFLPRKVLNEYQTVFRTGKALVTEEDNQFDSNKIYTETLKIPVLEKGKVARVVTVMRDITAHKKAEQALRDALETSQTLIELLPDAMVFMDLEFNIRAVSRVAIKLHGYEKAEDVLGKNALILVAPDFREKMLEIHQRILKEGIVRDEEVVMVKKDGNRFFAKMSVSLVKDQDGNPKGLLGLARESNSLKS